MTKAFNEKALFLSKDDFEESTVCIEIKSNEEVENIKSFILSDFFIYFVSEWKKIDGYGFNEAIKYLPPFDKTKHWTNDEVKEFIESFK